MKKAIKVIIISIVIILLIASLLIIFLPIRISGFTANEQEYNYSHTWTKAICNETHCQDYKIDCNENRMIKQTPITGAIIDIPENWVDPRNETERNRICE